MQGPRLLPSLFPILGNGILKEAFDSIINLSKVFITASKLDRISIDPQVLIPIDDLPIVDLVSVVGLGEDVLDHGAGVDDSLAHPVVLEGDEVVIFVIEAGGV
jgi:hypothetical protein